MKNRMAVIAGKALPFCFACGIYLLIYEGLGGCPIDRIFHLECPGCGCMKALFLLLRGDFKGSVNVQPFCIPYLTAVLAGIWPFRKGRRFVQWYVILAASGGLAYHLTQRTNFF